MAVIKVNVWRDWRRSLGGGPREGERAQERRRKRACEGEREREGGLLITLMIRFHRYPSTTWRSSFYAIDSCKIYRKEGKPNKKKATRGGRVEKLD